MFVAKTSSMTIVIGKTKDQVVSKLVQEGFDPNNFNIVEQKDVKRAKNIFIDQNTGLMTKP